MGKLIDGDKLISTLVWGHYGLGKQLQSVQQAINDMRGEDAVPVIRCKDCKFHHDRTQCKKRIGAWFDDDYCNGAVRAERKDE